VFTFRLLSDSKEVEISKAVALYST